MLRRQRIWLLLRAGALLALGGFPLPGLAAAEVGRLAPALVVRQLDGQELDLGALRGRTVVLNFWATWCAPCRAEMPALDSFYKHHRDDGVEVIGLSADDRHDRRDVVRVMQAFSFPAALASDAKVNGFGPVTGVPVTYIIGPDGIVRAILVPGNTVITEKSLAELVLPLLGQPETDQRR